MTWDQIESKLAVAAVGLIVLEIVGAIIVFMADDYGDIPKYVREPGAEIETNQNPEPLKVQSNELTPQKNQAPSREAALPTQLAQAQRPELGEPPVKLDMASNRKPKETSQPDVPAPPVKAPPEPLTTSAVEQEKLKILKTVEHWRASWQAQDVEAYIARYTETFRPSNKLSHKAWLRDRKTKLSRAKEIVVHLDNLQLIKVDDQRWKVTFRQHYQSATFSDNVTKELVLIKAEDQYLIATERVR